MNLKKIKFNKDSFFSNSIFIFLIRLFGPLANLVVIVLFSKSLTYNDYGNYVNFLLYLNIITVVGSFGSSVLFNLKKEEIVYFLKKTKSRFAFLGIFFLLLTAGVFTFYLHYKLSYPLSAHYILFGILLGLLYQLNFVLDTLTLILKRSLWLVVIAFIFSSGYIYIHYLNIQNESFNLFHLIQALCVISLIKFILLSVFLFNSVKGTIAVAPLVNLKTFKNQWLHLGVYDIGQIIFRNIDKIFITLIASSEAIAIYFNGRHEVPFLSIFLFSIRQSSILQFTQFNFDREAGIKLVRQGSLILFTIISCLFFFLFLFRVEIIILMFSEKYLPSLGVFVVSLFLLPAQYGSNLMFVLQGKNQGKIINMGAFLDMIVVIALMYPLYYFWGSVGIILSFVISTYAQTLFYIFHVIKILKTNLMELFPFRSWGLRLILFFGIHYCIYLIFKNNVSDLMLLIISGVSSGIIGLAIIFKDRKKLIL